MTIHRSIAVRVLHRIASYLRLRAPSVARACGGAVLALTALVVTVSGSTSGSPDSTTATESADREQEYKVKAAYLFHFISYTTWPRSSFERRDSPIVVMVVGGDPFGKRLDQALGDKKIDGRRVVVQRSRSVPREIDAHVVFEGSLARKDRAELLKRCASKSILLCGERSGYAKDGAHCNFFMDGPNVRFEINVDALERSKLEMSSELLKLAKIVRDER